MARFISYGFNTGKHLSTLLNFMTPAWKSNWVTVYTNGTAWGETPKTVWWGNPVEGAGDGSSTKLLNIDKTIYVVSNSITQSTSVTTLFDITAAHVGLVIAPGAVMHSTDATYAIRTQNNYIWLEGDLKASPGSVFYSIYVDTSSFVRLDHISDSNTIVDSIRIDASSYVRISDVSFANAPTGIDISNSSNIFITDVKASNLSSDLLFISSSTKISASEVTTASNIAYIVENVNSTNNVITNVTSANSIGYLVYLENSTYNAFMNILGVNSTQGIGLALNSDYNLFTELLAAYNTGIGISLDTSSNNSFLGQLLAGNNGTNCSVTGTTTNEGIDPSSTPDCVPNGNSTFTWDSTVDLTNSFVGKVTNDGVNKSDSNGSADFPTDVVNFDWTHFANSFRTWSIDDGQVFPSVTQQGQWTSGAGKIWDWSLRSTDTWLLNANGTTIPTGTDSITHSWDSGGVTPAIDTFNAIMSGSVFNTDHCETTFLKHAVEIMNDGIGNDNGLCESGETCLFTPNIGSYQGHGKLISAGDFVDGPILTSITLKKYQNNGVIIN